MVTVSSYLYMPKYASKLCHSNASVSSSLWTHRTSHNGLSHVLRVKCDGIFMSGVEVKGKESSVGCVIFLLTERLTV